MTEQNEIDFQNSTICHICEKPLDGVTVRDHDHISGEFRGAAHQSNLNYKFSKENENKDSSFFIPVILHNLRNFDSHLILQGIGQIKNKKISCIPNNMEKYISFSLGNLRFIDSFQFLNTSLEKLVDNLKADGLDHFDILKTYETDSKKLELLLRKGVYLYDYIDSEAKLTEQTLPTKHDFYNILSEKDISDDDYSHACEVWRHFNCKSLGDYHDIYLITDTLLLACVFENFRKICLNAYKLDPAHYYTAPGLAWDAMLRMTGIKLELITDIDMYLLVESGIRGGISMISNKYAKANNPYTPDYNPNRENNYIVY